MKRCLALCGLGALLVVLSPAAHATLLCLPNYPPGFAGANTNDVCPTDFNGTNPVGTLVADTGVGSFIFMAGTPSVTTDGNYREVVYRESDGFLDFYIQIQTNSGSCNGGGCPGVDSVNTGSFDGGVPWMTQVGTISEIQLLGTGGTDEPFFDYRTGAGDTINWVFPSPIGLGVTSYTLAIATNATLYAPGNIGLEGTNGGTETVAGFEPLAAVPEPVSIVLLGTVTALLALFIRRRQSAKVSKADTQA